jgi:chromosomal replication initiator protein
VVPVVLAQQWLRRLGGAKQLDNTIVREILRWGCCVEVLAPGILANIERELKERIGKPRYDLWFRGNTKLNFDDGTLTIGVPNRFYREWLENHFQQELRATAHHVFGGNPTIRFRIDPALFRRTESEPLAPARPEPIAATAPPNAVPTRFALSRFVVGPANRVAYSAAVSIVENPRNGFNPLFVYGGVGLGKTHLFRGVEEGLRQRHRSLKVLAVSGEEFVNQYIEALRAGRVTMFRRQFRQLDVLLVDDVQFLCHRRGCQEEFFHTFNSLDGRSAKILLSADVHPRQLPSLREELRMRFLAGMVARLDAPNREMRRQIVRDKAVERLLELPTDVVDWLADHAFSSVGELEGALNSLSHYCDTMQVASNLAAARAALTEILRHSTPTIPIVEVRRKLCELFGLRAASLAERTRTRSICHARMLLMYLARRYTQATYSEIGDHVGGLNHSTVIAAERRIADGLDRDQEIVLGERRWKIRDAVEAFERVIGQR